MNVIKDDTSNKTIQGQFENYPPLICRFPYAGWRIENETETFTSSSALRLVDFVFNGDRVWQKMPLARGGVIPYFKGLTILFIMM